MALHACNHAATPGAPSSQQKWGVPGKLCQHSPCPWSAVQCDRELPTPKMPHHRLPHPRSTAHLHKTYTAHTTYRLRTTASPVLTLSPLGTNPFSVPELCTPALQLPPLPAATTRHSTATGTRAAAQLILQTHVAVHHCHRQSASCERISSLRKQLCRVCCCHRPSHLSSQGPELTFTAGS